MGNHGRLIAAVVVALFAVGFRYSFLHNQEKGIDTIYAIGDLHGDVKCAKFWVDSIGVVDSVDNPQKWLDDTASLVFMGDYVDKGPYSYQTLRFIQSLTEQFPDRVTALMGNHEMELLKDRDPRRKVAYFHMPYATVHPVEYLNFLDRKVDETDRVVVDLLLNASLEVYAGKHYRSVVYAPVKFNSRQYLVAELMPESLQPVVTERLKEYQTAYLNAFRSNTTLGQWVEKRPVAHVQNGFFFCHGGINELVASTLTSEEEVDKFNQMVAAHTREDKFVNFLENSSLGRVARDLMLHRGNHKGNDPCGELATFLDSMDGVEHLVVGHTPGRDVRIQCNQQFLAIDSLLGRYIRTSGNHYCPDEGRRSRDGSFVCPPLTPICQGQIVKISGSDIRVIHPQPITADIDI